MMISRQYENKLAVISLLVSAALWGVIWYPLRLLDDAGLPGIWSSMAMYSAAAILVLPSLFSWPSVNQKGWLLGLALAAGVTNIAFVIALVEGEVMRVMLLFYLSPIWTVLLGRWWLGEKLSLMAMAYFILAMIGAVVMLWDPALSTPWPQASADWLALLAGMAFATNNVIGRKLANVEMKMKTAMSWWGCVVVATTVILLLGEPTPAVDVSIWLWACLLGWLGIVLMTVAIFYGLARMPVYRSSVIMLFELLVAAIAAWLLTDEVMSMQEWAGGILILMAGYGVIRTQVSK